MGRPHLGCPNRDRLTVEGNYRAYDWVASGRRIDGYLALPRDNYEEFNSLPDRDRLTFTNDFYANCSAIFVNIRDSSTSPTHYNRAELAKLYRAYLSEMVAIFDSDVSTREINIVGDAVSGPSSTPPARLTSTTCYGSPTRPTRSWDCTTFNMKNAEYDTSLRAGIAASWGRALMIKAGYRGNGINDAVYIGDVVSEAAHLATNDHKRS